MKKNIALLIILSFLFSVLLTAKTNYKAGDKLYVFAPSGINLREKASSKAPALLSVPYGSQVTVIEQTNESFEAENIKGYFVKATYNGKTGYLFDGLLSSLPAPDLNKGLFLGSYADKYFSKLNNFNESKDGATITGTKYKNGAIYKLSRAEGGSSQELTIPKITITEAFLLLKSLGVIDSKELFPVKTAAYKIKAKSNLSGQIVDIEINVTYSEENGNISIRIERNAADGDLTAITIEGGKNSVTIGWSRAD